MTNQNTEENGKKVAYQVGVFVMIVLGVLTLGEFAISVVAPPWYWALILIALVKAWLIVRDYMHLGRLFSGEEEEHE